MFDNVCCLGAFLIMAFETIRTPLVPILLMAVASREVKAALWETELPHNLPPIFPQEAKLSEAPAVDMAEIIPATVKDA